MLTRYTLLLVGFMAFAFGLQAQTYYMSNSVIVNCTGDFYDDGGPTANYTSSMPGPITFTSDDVNKHMTVHFDSIRLSSSDELRVYDGTSVTVANLIYTIKGAEGKKKNIAFSSKNIGGSLTFDYYQGYYDTAEGWVASISCCSTASAGTLTTNNNTLCAGDTATMTIEGSYCGELVWQSSADGTTWSDISGKKGPIAKFLPTTDTYYRAKFVSTSNTVYSGAQLVDVNCYKMGNAATVTSCGLDFYDDGGATGNVGSSYNGYYGGGGSYTVTFYPEITGEKVMLDFNSIDLDSTYESLIIYNGINSSATKLGTLSGTVSNRSFTSSHATGALTVYFSGSYSGYSSNYAGWDADLTCCSAVDNSNVTLVSSETTICGGVDFDLTLTGTYCGQATYEYSDDAGSTWTALSGKIGPHITTNTTRDRSYRAVFTYGANVLYSNVVAVDMNCFEMGNATSITSCDFTFHDDGGATGNVGSSYNGYSGGGGSSTVTFYPEITGQKVKIDFNSLSLDSSYYYNYEYLTVYSGTGTSATNLGSMSGTVSNRTFVSSDTSGALTVYFSGSYSGYSSNFAGWDANVTCCNIVDGSQTSVVTSKNTICAGETVELTLSGTYCGQAQWQSSTDGSTWADISGKIGPSVSVTATQDQYYRAKFSLSTTTDYSPNTVFVDVNCAYMDSTSVATGCNIDFYDAGGPNGATGYNYNNNTNSVTFYPENAADKVKVTFNTISLEGAYETLSVYDGPTASGSPVAVYAGTMSNQTYTSTHASGALTVSFFVYEGTGDGWDADVTCEGATPPTADGTNATLTTSVSTACENDPISVAIGGSYVGSIQWQESIDQNTWSDISGAVATTLNTNLSETSYYRVKLTSGATTDYTSAVQVTLNCVKMGFSQTVTVCSESFYDEGGASGNYPNFANDTLVAYPATSGAKLVIEFGTFDIKATDTLYIYDGTSPAAPILAKLNGTDEPANVEATNSQGALTFVFISQGSNAGWEAGFHCVQSSITCEASVSAFLLGAFEESTLTMHDKLREAKLLPSTSPYTALPGFTQVNDGNTYSIDAGVLDVSGATAIVDWIWLELRLAEDSSIVECSRPALIRRDAQIVDMDGVSDVTFLVAPDNYFVSVRHRNHLGIMSATAQPINASDTPTVDLKKATVSAYGTNARKQVGIAMCMWPGDADGNGQVTAVGGSSDVTPITQAVLLDVANTVKSKLYFKTGYHSADLNMDGKVAMVGSATEVTLITSNVVLHPDNSTKSILKPIKEQLPE